MGQQVLIIHEHGYPNNAQWSGVLLYCMMLGNQRQLLVPMVAIVSFAQYELEHAQNCTRTHTYMWIEKKTCYTYIIVQSAVEDPGRLRYCPPLVRIQTKPPSMHGYAKQNSLNQVLCQLNSIPRGTANGFIQSFMHTSSLAGPGYVLVDLHLLCFIIC